MDGDTEAVRWNALHPIRDAPARVIHTKSADDVKVALLEASAASMTVAAISAGQNIGLGGRLGPWTADHLIDLSQHRALVSLDERLGVAEIEPGLTFADLHAALRGRQSRWYFPTIGGPPEASVIGNILQCGDGTGPGGDRRTALLSLDVMLRSGERIRTRGSVGPDMTGLFVQSDLGIVVGAKIALVPLPKFMQGFLLRLSGTDELGRLIEGLADAMRNGAIAPGAVAIWNGVKHGLRTGTVGAPDTWFASGAMHGASEARLQADWRDLIRSLHAAGSDARILERAIDRNPSGSGVQQGEPTRINMPATRSGLGPNADPAAAGFAWVCPVLPLVASDVARLVAITRETLAAYAIPPNMSLTCHDHRTIRAFIALAWDRSDRTSDRAAVECHNRLIERLAAAGYPPFRLGHLSRDWAAASPGDEAAVLRRIAEALAKRSD